jgi:hypothetical protein
MRALPANRAAVSLGRAFLVSKIKVKIRVSNGPLFHLVVLRDDYYGAAGVAGQPAGD